jgi:N-dimethylarginine dimethylaminohydrolase
MTGELLSVMVCPPDHAGWNGFQRAKAWEELGYLHRPDFDVAREQHEKLCRALRNGGAQVVCLPPEASLSLDAVYVHDASFPTDYGAILMNPGKKNRAAEAISHGSFYSAMGARVLGRVCEPGTCEAGDMVWLDARTLLIGRGYRTNAEGIAQVRALLVTCGVEVLSAPLPYGPGPSACLHLMSLMSMLDERTVLVDLPRLAVETVELLKSRGFRLIEIDYSERETLACNVLSLGKGRLVAIEENVRTNCHLRDVGFDVSTFPGSEICINGSGGPTCLTRPLLRS